jgi:arylsulfatase A-like enzyme
VAPERDTTTSIVLLPSATPRFRSMRAGAIADVHRAIVMATGGALAFGAGEYALTLWGYSSPVPLGAKLRLVPIVATLSLVLWTILVVGLAAGLLVARVVGGWLDGARARGPGWLAVRPVAATSDGRPEVPAIWAAVLVGGALAAVIQRFTASTLVLHKEPQSVGVRIAVWSVIFVVCSVPVLHVVRGAVAAGSTLLAPVLRTANPLGRLRAAGIAIACLVVAGLITIWYVLPETRSGVPSRHVVSALLTGLGMGFATFVDITARDPRRPLIWLAAVPLGGAVWFSKLPFLARLPLVLAIAGTAVWIAGALPARSMRRRRSRTEGLAVAGATCAMLVMTFLVWGADLGSKYVAVTGSPALDELVKIVRIANDVDFDGFGSLFGEKDCNPLSAAIHPGARDKPDDGIDQNCDGHDFSLKAPRIATGPTKPVPQQFQKPWNILLITIDALRYDHTTFGGYKDSPKHRDTTPELAKLVSRSTSFSFCNAPSAGTMASIPAIMTSKFFHSGIALDENMPPGTPPKLKPENVLLSEIMKRGGYRTGVIGSHDWWNDWGLDQGVDDYDNTIGKTPDPRRVAADKVTDHILAWVARQQGQKWFMWAHYIDPHGYYIAHPDVVDYGASDADLYDAEIRWTDQQIGRLLDELVRLPSTDNTIIIITADHGESMAEHNVPLGTHGTALYRELQNVPLIFYVPENPPRVIGGAVTNLDIVPTVAELTNIDVHDLSFEGRSLVPQLFYDNTTDHDRIVFAETNAPTPQRAAISEAWKLIYYMQSNLYELYDLRKDPWEHENLAPSHPPEMDKMREALDDWLERVVYSRDQNFNQAAEKTKDVLLAAAPHPGVATSGQSLDGGRIEILGIDVAQGQHVRPGARVDIHVYFATKERSQIGYKFLLAAWPIEPTWKPGDPAPPTMMRSALRITADGFFPTDRWRPGEFVRERFNLLIPSDWKSDRIAIGLVATDPAGNKVTAAGASPENDHTLAILGVLPVEGSSPPPQP